MRGTICFVRDLEDCVREDNLSGADLKAASAEILPSGVSFSPAIQTLPRIHTAIRNWLNKNEAASTQHASHRIIMTLAIAIYIGPEDANAAVDLGRAKIKKNRARTSTASTTTAQMSQTAGNGRTSQISNRVLDALKMAHNVSMRFRMETFTGDIVVS